MKKQFLTTFLLMSALSLGATVVHDETPVVEYQFSSFDKPNPRVKATHRSPSTTLESPRKAKGDEPVMNTVPVKIKFLHDTKSIVPQQLYIVNDEETLSTRLTPDINGECTAEFPEGIYDFSFQMQEYRYYVDNDPKQGWTKQGTYFFNIDDVEVKEGMPVIEVDAQECHPIVPEFHLANGEAIRPDVVDYSDFDNPKIIKPGNIAHSVLFLDVFNEGRKKKLYVIIFSGLIEDDATLQTNGLNYHTIYVNNASDKWCYFGNWEYVNSDYSEVYSFTYNMRPSDTKVSFTPADQVLLPWNFSRSKTYDANADKRSDCCSIDLMYKTDKPGYPSGGSALNMMAEKPKVYVGDKSSDFVTSGYILTDVEGMNDWWMNSGIGSCEMTIEDGQIKYLQTQRGAFGAILMGGAYDEAKGKTSTHNTYYNGHKRFSSNDPDFTPVFGKTAPILRVVNDISYDKNNNDAYSNRINPYCVGQYGEIRDSDVECGNLTTKFTFNGDVVEENFVGNPIMFEMEGNENGQKKGVMEYEMLTENIFEDGIEGYNRTYIYTDQTKEDPTAPTLTHMMCRDTDDHISNRFATPDNGVLEFSASDFSSEEFWMPDGWNDTWFESHPIQEVKAEWSPYGLNEWSEFKVEEVPEYFEEGFGHFYRGSLAGVDRTSSNGWYDLRVTLRDATGNLQQQTISPVFRIETVSGVESIETAADSANAEYFNMQGMRISNPAAGQIVIKRQGNSVTKQIMK